MQKITIIGAGLSGLYAALLLQEHFHVTVLEARDRLGGRIHTIDGFDMGPSWIWSHQKEILQLIQKLNLTLFSQYTAGEALYHTYKGVERFKPPPSAPSARLDGGLMMLIEAIAKQLKPNTIAYKQAVSTIEYQNPHIITKTNEQCYESDYVIVTLPPRLAEKSIIYQPPLPLETQEKMRHIPTWMGHMAKCVITYEHAFWKDAGLSGFVFSHQGPLSEIHDASLKNRPALFGFTRADESKEHLHHAIKEQLITLFGPKAVHIKAIHFVDWRREAFSSTSSDAHALTNHPNYGHNITHFDDKLYFIGTESAFNEGGYLEGAIISAKKIADLFTSKVRL